MCGIVGIFERKSIGAEVIASTVARMADALAHRGPDDSGVWVDSAEGVGIGHRRLAIIDTSSAGRQPMISSSGRYVIAFNGEIYNFQDIASRLADLGHRFVGHSDTEVLIAAIEQWGLDRSLLQSSGMFALALWDRSDRVLHLARDRLGEKPLYYGWQGGTFLFASELKALRHHSAWNPQLRRSAVSAVLRYGYVPTPLSIYEDIYKLAPGTVLSLSLASLANRSLFDPDPDSAAQSRVKPRRYWSLRQTAMDGLHSPLTDSSLLDELDDRLHESVRRQMVADVPVGALLSGGIDSSLVVAAMRNVSNAPIKTFTVGFHEPEFDESEPARAVARHLGTDHTALYIGASDALELVPTLTEVYDEPFADPSQLPTLLISKLARRSVTVALSGDGGDEFFGGYNRYLATDRLWRRIQKIPFFIRAYIGRRIQSIRPDMLGAFASTFEARVLGRKQLTPNAGSKLLKIGGLMQQPSLVMAYRHLISYWDDPRSVTGVEEPVSHIGATSTALLADGSFIDQAMYWDQVSYLLDDNLTKIDRASMAYGLETRLPLLDHSLVGLAWRIPSGLRVHQGQTKWPLRQILYRYVPQELLDRPKMGFSVPIGSWLRGPLRDWAEDLFRAETANPKLDFDMRIVWSLWSRHLTRASNADLRLWSVLMLIDWAHRSTRWHGRGN